MNKLIASLRWIDNNLLKMLLAVFIFFIPLYPKIPLKIVNFTYIAIRLEDYFIAFIVFVFFIQLLRRKAKLHTRFLWMFLLFWTAVFTSFFYAYYVQGSIVYEYVGLFNTLRRVEYMIVFFAAASTIKNKKDFWFYIICFLIAVFMVGLYGIGQKFLGFPAVQTMNPEYAKGRILYLTPEVRISSTFAGHYDLAAYFVFAFPFIIAAYAMWDKFRYIILFALSVFAFLYTSSRISSIAYLVIFPFLTLNRKWKALFFAVVITAIGLYTTRDLTDRFLKTLQIKQILVNEQTGEVFIPQKITTKELPAGSFYVQLPDRTPPAMAPILPVTSGKTATAEFALFKEGIVQQKINEREKKLGKILSPGEIREIEASLAALLKPLKTVVSDISFATRLQVEWPRAIAAFKSNIFLGLGPSTITEATDNDFLRWLGEFGLFGTLTFLLILFSLMRFIYKQSKSLDKQESFFMRAAIYAILGLLINATYIDVFEASKVAFIFWAMMGFIVGFLELKINNKS